MTDTIEHFQVIPASQVSQAQYSAETNYRADFFRAFGIYPPSAWLLKWWPHSHDLPGTEFNK